MEEENKKIWKELQSSLKYDCYELVDDMSYGIYRLHVVNDRDKICISVIGKNLSAVGKIDKTNFINMEMGEFFNYVNMIIYYNMTEDSEN